MVLLMDLLRALAKSEATVDELDSRAYHANVHPDHATESADGVW